jgi:hypothetical protein
MKRGPRLMNLIDNLPKEDIEYYRSCSIDTPHYGRFLDENNIMRVEFDNLLQGIDIKLSNLNIQASLYIPYAYVTVTRFCLASSCDEHGKEDMVGIFPCRKECQKYTFNLMNEIMNIPLIRKGNTIFFKNDKIPENLNCNNINRLVIQPEVPI